MLPPISHFLCIRKEGITHEFAIKEACGSNFIYAGLKQSSRQKHIHYMTQQVELIPVSSKKVWIKCTVRLLLHP